MPPATTSVATGRMAVRFALIGFLGMACSHNEYREEETAGAGSDTPLNSHFGPNRRRRSPGAGGQ